MLKNAPMFKKVQGRGGGAGRGKSAILRAQGVFTSNFSHISLAVYWAPLKLLIKKENNFELFIRAI